MKLYSYIKQDGMNNTLEILITDEYKRQDELPPYWRRNTVTKDSFPDLLYELYKGYMWGAKDIKYIKYNAEDEYIIDIDTIKMMNLEKFI